MTAPGRAGTRPPKPLTSLEVGVQGYKSLRDEIRMQLRPLTLVAGANSSGKSSFMQALLLLKQTLEVQFDPGPLLLNGPNVALTSTQQLFSRGKAKHDTAAHFVVSMNLGEREVRLRFNKPSGKPVGIVSMYIRDHENAMTIHEGEFPLEPTQLLRDTMRWLSEITTIEQERPAPDVTVRAIRNRCFLIAEARIAGTRLELPYFSVGPFRNALLEMIHVPGLRGNPDRVYPTSAVGRSFPGTFERYVASLIYAWQSSRSAANVSRLNYLNNHLHELGLTWKVHAKPADDTSVELLVGRLPHAQQGGAHDMVSIADVGFGVSQTLPVLVALVAARPGQIVYLEQPEIHLHPRAQTGLAKILAWHAQRGVIVVAETHSSLLIRATQTAIAQGFVDNRNVALHWFTRSIDTGVTAITSASPDRRGRFHDWPIDFDDVALEADVAYLNAVEAGDADE